MPVSETSVAGWRGLELANDRLSVTVLPERGAEMHALVDRASGTDVLFHAPWGLAPPGAPPRGGSDGHVFLERYAGGWQELFPSCNDPCMVDGQAIPFHGEVAIMPWSAEVRRDEPDAAEVLFAVECQATPFRLERLMRLEAGSSTLVLEETATNTSGREAHCTWGHHLVLGAPFLGAGCRLELPVDRVVTIPEMWEDTARLEPGQDSAWPHARLRTGGTVDLREVPGPEAGSHDDVYLGRVSAGWASVESPELGLRVRLGFDPELFHWIISWQAYGGAVALPLADAYALGVEPWVSRLALEGAIEAGEAIAVAAGGTLRTTFTVSLEEIR